MLSCGPNSGNGWLPFSDPEVNESEEDTLLRRLTERVLILNKEYHLTPFEKSTWNLKLILRQNGHELEAAYAKYIQWIKWRRSTQCEEITDEAIKPEIDSGIARWRGKDKAGRPCLVLTGRMMDAPNTRTKSFQKFLIKTAEDGLRAMDEENKIRKARREVKSQGIQEEKMQREISENRKESDEDSDMDEFCVIYDRRGLDYSNISATAYSSSRNVVASLKEYYGSRLGKLYVLESNVLFWTLYHFILKPLTSISLVDDKIVVVETVPELLEYFDDDQLLLMSPTESAQNRKSLAASDATEKSGDTPSNQSTQSEESVIASPSNQPITSQSITERGSYW